MKITISEQAIVDTVERHIRIASRNSEFGDFTSALRFSTHIAAADAILAMAEKEAGIKARRATSVNGLTKRLNSLIGGGSAR